MIPGRAVEEKRISENNICWLIQEDGVEGHKLNYSHVNTTNCWTTTDKKDWNLMKKIFYNQSQRRSQNKTMGGVQLQLKSHAC